LFFPELELSGIQNFENLFIEAIDKKDFIEQNADICYTILREEMCDIKEFPLNFWRIIICH
jgi:hypothetical protein